MRGRPVSGDFRVLLVGFRVPIVGFGEPIVLFGFAVAMGYPVGAAEGGRRAEGGGRADEGGFGLIGVGYKSAFDARELEASRVGM